MRADSTSWREAISAFSRTSLRAISSLRVSPSDAIVSAAVFLSWAMRAERVACRAAISASSTARLRAISWLVVS